MRVLVIGASGQLGQALCLVFGRRHDVRRAVRRDPGPGQLVIDLGQRASMLAGLDEAKPELVLIAGAQTHVDGCEAEAEGCLRVNADGPAVVAEFARETGIPVVYYSTDYVFDGGRPSYGEDDPVAPLNAYGRSKAAGEAAIRALAPDRHLILRTSWMYGPDVNRRNFALRLVDTLSRPGPPVRIPSDQWGNPTYTEDVAAATEALVAARQWGTFHAAGPDLLDRATLARRICSIFDVDAGRVVPTPTSDLGQVAARPLRVALRSERLAATGLARFKDVDAGLRALRAVERARP